MGGSEVLLTMLGAVALLLWGVRMVRTGLTRAFAGPLRTIMGEATRNRMTAFAAGIGITGVLQSATATALLLASFAGRGLITLPLALAVMLGADVGSTLVAQLFAFDVRWLWPVLMLAGVVAFNASRSERSKSLGRILIGLGLMLLALGVIANVSGALRESPTMTMVISSFESELLLGAVVAGLATWLAHSSLAIILFVMSLAAGEIVKPQLALALVLGANVGGAIAPWIALSGSPMAARRVPIGNLLARTITALALLPFVTKLTPWLELLSKVPSQLVLNFHCVFNLTVALVFLPLLGPLAGIVERLLPDPKLAPDPSQPQHLDPSALETPSEALGCALRETLAVGDIVHDMLRRSLAAIETNDLKLIKEIERTDDNVDALYEAIKLYLIRASKADMDEAESRRYVEILTFTTNLEHIGDIIDKNLMELAQKKAKKGYAFSAEGLAELKRFHAQVLDNMRLALNVFALRDVALARRLLLAKTDMRASEFDAANKHFARLKAGRPESIETSSIHLDIVRDLKRINSHLTSVAYPILEAAGELNETRLKLERAAVAASKTA